MALAGDRTFVGFGFGPIQSGLFAYEAFACGNFARLVIAEVDREIVAALRANGGRYALNIARADGIDKCEVGPVEVYDPAQAGDREELIRALADASEAATAVPSTKFYLGDGPGSLHRILAQAAARRSRDEPLIVYAAENDNEAASILERAVRSALDPALRHSLEERLQFLDTVIGKMSLVVDGESELAARGLAPLVPTGSRAHLVESFRRILVGRPRHGGGRTARRGIDAFEEKRDLLPFEEAKLYGHNAAHALAAYIAPAACAGARRAGRPCIERVDLVSQLAEVPGAVEFVRSAFLEESGGGLIARHAGVDPLFTRPSFAAHVGDLIDRMLNPHLGDRIVRIARDPRRKLGWRDRLVGTMRLALAAGIEPRRFALGAAAAVRSLTADPHAAAETRGREVRGLLEEIWRPDRPSAGEAARIAGLIETASGELEAVRAGKPLAP